MSVCNIFLSGQAIHVWTDGASYDDDQVFECACTKVAALPHLNAAVVVRGTQTILGPVLSQANNATSFDDLVADLVPMVEHVAREDLVFVGDERRGIFEVFAAGWSGATPGVYRVRSDARHVETAGKAIITPADQPLMERLKSEFPDLNEDNVHRRKYAGRIMALQRERARERAVDAHWERWAVGGFVQLTTITRAAITLEIVQRWPDRPGHYVGAFG